MRIAQSLMGLVTVLALEASSISEVLAQAVDQASSGSPAADPCTLLTDAEVRKVFPDAKAGKRDRSVDKYGIASCVWDHPGGRFALQVQTSEPGTVKNEIEGFSLGFIDPLKSGADRNVRYETIKDVGDQAMAVVERADAARGILSDSAFLIAQRRDQQVNLMSTQLARRERAEALQALEDLGRAAVQRL